MSVVILGGNECMERRYRELCESYQCQSKIFTKPAGGLRNKLGSPDLTIFFTNTMSHKMVQGGMERIILKGEISSPIEPKPGCRFAGRCIYATEACIGSEIPLTEYEPGHFTACVRIHEINGLVSK